MGPSLYLPLVLVAAVAGAAVAFLAWLNRDEPGARPLTLFLLAASAWATTEALSVVAPVGAGSLFWARVGLVVSAVVPAAWLVTVLEYTGPVRRLHRGLAAVLVAEPAVFAALVWTNPRGLVWRTVGETAVGGYRTVVLEYGLGFWAHQVYAYLLVVAGGLLLFRLIVVADGVHRAQGTALLAAIALPMTGKALYVFGLGPRGLDPTGGGYVLSGTLIAGAMLRQELLTLAPVTRDLGREAVVSDLADPVVTLDHNDRVVDLNDAAERLVEAPDGDHLGADLGTVLPAVEPALKNGGGEVSVDREDGVRYYDVRVSELSGGFGVVGGRLVSLRDVTERRRREQRLDVLNRLLRHNLRNELNVVRGNVELARRAADAEEVTGRLAAVADTVDTVVRRSDKVGTLSRSLETDDEGPVDLARLLRASPGLDREPVRLDLPDRLPVGAGPAVEVAFEELVANAVEHDDGDPSVTVTTDEYRSDADDVVVAVADTGPGIDDHEWQTVLRGEETPLRHASGVGLWLVNWVVERFGGRLAFENTDDGAVVRVRLPRADPDALGGTPDHGAGDAADAPGETTAEATEGSGGRDRLPGPRGQS